MRIMKHSIVRYEAQQKFDVSIEDLEKKGAGAVTKAQAAAKQTTKRGTSCGLLVATAKWWRKGVAVVIKLSNLIWINLVIFSAASSWCDGCSR